MFPTDAEVWSEVRKGSRTAFASLFDRHSDAVYRYCLHQAYSVVDAEELTSSTFLVLWEHRLRLQVVATATALPLLFGIARNLSAHHRRSFTRYRRAMARVLFTHARVEQGDSVAASVLGSETLREIGVAIKRLPENQRVVAELCLIGGLDIRTVAAELSLAEGTVKSRLSRARSELRVALTPSPKETVEEDS